MALRHIMWPLHDERTKSYLWHVTGPVHVGGDKGPFVMSWSRCMTRVKVCPFLMSWYHSLSKGKTGFLSCHGIIPWRQDKTAAFLWHGTSPWRKYEQHPFLCHGILPCWLAKVCPLYVNVQHTFVHWHTIMLCRKGCNCPSFMSWCHSMWILYLCEVRLLPCQYGFRVYCPRW